MIITSPSPAPAPCRTVAEAYQIDCPCLHLPRYPRYPEGRGAVGDFPYVYLRSARYAACQAARFVLIGGAGVVTAVEEGVVDPLHDLPSRWSGFFLERFGDYAGEVVRYRGEGGFEGVAEAWPGHVVLSPHPFDSGLIPARRYYLADPALVARLNDKGEMDRLSGRVIPYLRCTPAEFAADAWRARWPLPFVVKLVAPSGGGDGVALCYTEADLSTARVRFAGQAVKVERLIEDIRRNLNVNLRVTREGAIEFIGCSEQRIEAGGTYCGNCIDLTWRPWPDLERLCTEVARCAWRQGWHGICGLDIIETGSGELHLMDPNFRLNGSTPFYFLREHFSAIARRPCLETGYFHFRGPPEGMLDACAAELRAGALVPVGLYHDAEDGWTRLYGALVCDGDPGIIPEIKGHLARKGLQPGVALQ